MLMILSAIALSLPTQSLPTIEFEGDEVILPTNLATRHIAVTVEIEGEEFLFQVDTYASIAACVDDDLAKRFGFETIGTTMNTDGVTTREKQLVNIERLTSGNAVFNNLRTLVDDYDWIERKDGRKVAGLLGFAAFREVLLCFDYPAQRLVLRRGTLDADGEHVLPYFNPSGSPDIDLVFGDEKLRFGIDTGSMTSLSMHKHEADELPLATELRIVGKAQTVYREYSIWGADIDPGIGLAGHELGRMQIEFAENIGRRMIGYEVVKDFIMTFDQRNQLVSFEQPASDD